MGVFDDVVVNAKSAANAVGKKAEKVVDISKIRFAISDVKKEISSKMESLGFYVYESVKDDDFTVESLAEKRAEIDELYTQLESLKAQLATAKNKIRCPECSFDNSKEAVFCMKCGTKLVD